MDIKLIVYTIIVTVAAMFFPAQHILCQNTSAGIRLRTVVIDPGHGGKDPGTAGPDRKNDEKQIVLKISKLLGEKIRKEYPEVKVVYGTMSKVYTTSCSCFQPTLFHLQPSWNEQVLSPRSHLR